MLSTVCVMLVQLGRNMYPVTRTRSHAKTRAFPAPNWRGNCGTQYLLGHVPEGEGREGYQCGGRCPTSADGVSIQRWRTAGDEQLACPGADHHQRWGAGPWLYCRAQTGVGRGGGPGDARTQYASGWHARPGSRGSMGAAGACRGLDWPWWPAAL